MNTSSSAAQLAEARGHFATSMAEVRVSLLKTVDPTGCIDTEGLPDDVKELLREPPTLLDMCPLVTLEEQSFFGGKFRMRLVEQRPAGSSIINVKCEAGAAVHPHFHDMDEIIVIVKGTLRELTSGITYRRGNVSYVPAGVTHAPYAEVESEWEVLILPPAHP